MDCVTTAWGHELAWCGQRVQHNAAATKRSKTHPSKHVSSVTVGVGVRVAMRGCCRFQATEWVMVAW
ncbi:hypothetical protein GCM10027074_69740 [Streptomyces deserti]